MRVRESTYETATAGPESLGTGRGLAFCLISAEGVGFEPTSRGHLLAVFKSARDDALTRTYTPASTIWVAHGSRSWSRVADLSHPAASGRRRHCPNCRFMNALFVDRGEFAAMMSGDDEACSNARAALTLVQTLTPLGEQFLLRSLQPRTGRGPR